MLLSHLRSTCLLWHRAFQLLENKTLRVICSVIINRNQRIFSAKWQTIYNSFCGLSADFNWGIRPCPARSLDKELFFNLLICSCECKERSGDFFFFPLNFVREILRQLRDFPHNLKKEISNQKKKKGTKPQGRDTLNRFVLLEESSNKAKLNLI